MAREGSQLQPYRGTVLRLAPLLMLPTRWMLSVGPWEDGPRRARPMITEVFNEATLRGQLVAAGFPLRRIVIGRGQWELTLHAVRSDIPAGSSAKLLGVLTEDYRSFKGRPIAWTAIRR